MQLRYHGRKCLFIFQLINYLFIHSFWSGYGIAYISFFIVCLFVCYCRYQTQVHIVKKATWLWNVTLTSFLHSLPLLLLLFSQVVCVIQLFGMAKNQSSRLPSFLPFFLSPIFFLCFSLVCFFYLFIYFSFYLFIYLFISLFIHCFSPLSSLIKKTLPHGIEPWTQRLTAARSTN